MNLLHETVTVLGWLYRIGKAFVCLRPVTTVIVIASSTLSRIASILAFVLPLKIILLVASDGVSRWFQPLIGTGSKDTLVVILTVAAVVSFFASILLDALTDHLAASTSRTVLSGSNELAVVGNQFGHARSIYAQFTELTAGALFAGTGLAVVAAINPTLGGILVAALLSEFLLTAAVLARTDTARPRFPARFVLHDLGDFLKILASLNFLLAFGVLLYPFIWGDRASVLGALVCIIVLRRAFMAMVEVVRGVVGMAGRKPMIDALVFRDRQYQQAERREARSLRDVFHKAARQARTTEALRSAGIECHRVEVHWQDSRLEGVSLLAVHGEQADGTLVHYQQQIFPAKQDYRIRNEDVLFSHVERSRLHAPRLILRFEEGPFQCQLCQSGSGELVDAQSWSETQWFLYRSFMAVAPPAALIDAFSLSRPLLVDRLPDAAMEKLKIGVDTETEQATLDALQALMPDLRKILRGLPLAIDNPELRWPNVMRDEAGAPLVMSWGQWKLEPLGATLPAGLQRTRLEALAAELRTQRSDIPDDLTVDHLQLAGTAYQLEKRIRHNLMKDALAAADRIVANPVLAPGPS